MKKMAGLLVVFLGLLMVSGCATLASLKAELRCSVAGDCAALIALKAEEARKERLEWWSEAVGRVVVDVKEDYSDSEIPSTRVKTKGGAEFIFH